MKKTIMLVLCLSAFAFAGVSAQTVPADKSIANPRREQRAALTPEQRAERQTRHLARRLSLTPDQQAAVASITLRYAKQVQTLRGNGERSPDKRKQLGDLMRSKDTELKRVFSAEQYKQYTALKAEVREKRQQRRGRQGHS